MGKKKKKKKKKSLPSMSSLTSPSVVKIIMEATERKRKEEAKERKRKENEAAIKRSAPKEFTWEQIVRFASGVKFKDNKENLKPSPKPFINLTNANQTNGNHSPESYKGPSYYDRWYELVTGEMKNNN